MQLSLVFATTEVPIDDIGYEISSVGLDLEVSIKMLGQVTEW